MLTAMPRHTEPHTSAYASPSPYCQQPLLLMPHDRESTASAPPPPASALARQHQHRPEAAKPRRRPRPSRRLPTTYISADPAEFRRMVHQVTGAGDLPVVPPRTEEEGEADHLLLHCRHPASAPVAGAGAMLLPTLDTSAFLFGRHSEAPPCDGSAAGLLPLHSNASDGAGAAGSYGFPTLESWDWDLL